MTTDLVKYILKEFTVFFKSHLSGNFKGDRKDKGKLILAGEGTLALGNSGRVVQIRGREACGL